MPIESLLHSINQGLWVPRASELPTAGKIKEMKDAPGGGYLLTLTDPEGFPINLMYNQTPAPKGQMPEVLETNYEDEKPRVARFQRFKPGPAAVHKVGLLFIFFSFFFQKKL